jgi:ATP-grasp domain, R2K clade family 3
VHGPEARSHFTARPVFGKLPACRAHRAHRSASCSARIRSSEAAARVRSRFFTMDLARRTTGEWIIVELGDGQVAGLRDGADAGAFFRAIGARLAKGP